MVMAILDWPSEFSIKGSTFIPKTRSAAASWQQMCNSTLSTVQEFSSILTSSFEAAHLTSLQINT